MQSLLSERPVRTGGRTFVTHGNAGQPTTADQTQLLTAAPEAAPSKHAETFALVESFMSRSFEVANLLLGGNFPGVHAVRPAYFALYNVSLESGQLLELELGDLLVPKAQARNGVRLPHSNLAALTYRLTALTEPIPAKLGEKVPAAQVAFTLCRTLQKYRRVADYMGCETLNDATARLLVQQAQDLATKIWSYTRANCN
jgi:hypothetical protein